MNDPKRYTQGGIHQFDELDALPTLPVTHVLAIPVREGGIQLFDELDSAQPCTRCIELRSK